MPSLNINSSVGKKGTNNGEDVKIVTALVNVYLRSQNKKELPISIQSSSDLEQAIHSFQSSHIKLSKPDSRVDPGGTTIKSLHGFLAQTFMPQTVVKPGRGLVTWEAEGAEGGRYHSRKLHVPSNFSGLTIGRGYDLRSKSASSIAFDLSVAGVDPKTIAKLNRASGLFGSAAEKFIIGHNLPVFSQHIRNRGNWLNVPLDRYNRRITYLKNALASARQWQEMYPSY